jgi:hypothetical protein
MHFHKPRFRALQPYSKIERHKYFLTMPSYDRLTVIYYRHGYTKIIEQGKTVFRDDGRTVSEPYT